MRVELERNYWPSEHGQPGLSVFGSIRAKAFSAISCERGWLGNKPYLSCVPAGFYYLEPHDGRRYTGTFALIGAQVSHEVEGGVARSACVLHWAASGSGLGGCVSAGHRLVATVHDVGLERPAMQDLVKLLRGRPAGERHYLEITEAFPIST